MTLGPGPAIKWPPVGLPHTPPRPPNPRPLPSRMICPDMPGRGPGRGPDQAGKGEPKWNLAGFGIHRAAPGHFTACPAPTATNSSLRPGWAELTVKKGTFPQENCPSPDGWANIRQWVITSHFRHPRLPPSKSLQAEPGWYFGPAGPGGADPIVGGLGWASCGVF